MRGRRRHSALIVSALLHLAALLCVWRMVPRQLAQPKRPPLELTLRSPPVEPTVPKVDPLPEKRLAAPKVRPPIAQPPAKPTGETPRVAAESGAPRNDEKKPLTLPSFVLPPAGTGMNEAPRAHGDDGLDEGTRVTRRLAELSAEHARHANAKLRAVDPRTAQIAHGIQNAFDASVAAAKRETNKLNVPVIGRIVDDVVGGIEQHFRDVEARNHPDPKLPKAGEVGLSTAGADQPDGTQNTKNERRPHADVPMICLGACGIGSHEHLRLSTTIDVEHDERGVPLRWTIAQSSGSVPFDDGALGSVELALGCMRDNGHHVLFCRPLVESTLGPVPRRSKWVLHGIVRRWTHMERVLDPQFKPAGRYIGSGPLSGNYLESAVELVELAYWD